MSAVEFARRPGGEELPEGWKDGVQKTLKAILAVNDEERVLLAHSRLLPRADGSVEITRLTARGALKIKKEQWTQDDFKRRCAKLEGLISKVQNIRKELDTLVLRATEGEDTFRAVAEVPPLMCPRNTKSRDDEISF